MSDYSYGWEKLHLAMHSLVGGGTRQERLANAVAFNLIHIRPEENLPPSLRDDFKAFMKQMTSVNAKGNEGTIQATVATLDEWGLKQATDRIIGFYDAVCLPAHGARVGCGEPREPHRSRYSPAARLGTFLPPRSSG